VNLAFPNRVSRMPTMQVTPFYYEALKVIQSGPWDPSTFGVVSIHTEKRDERMKVFINLYSDTPIEFEIDCYHWIGSRLYLTTRGVTKWVFEALN
jgi:hypothetical protein